MSTGKTKQKALSLVGQGYIYGAKGQTCSPAFRQQQAAQYPDQADNILGIGAKWDGMPVWDCAQLTRAAAKEGGVTLPSGATSQWNKAEWKRKGEINTLPQDEVCFLYRRQNGSATVMAHTGVYLGDGTEVDARGTRYGVLHQPVGEYAWTHWASPWDAGEAPEEKEDDPVAVLYRATVVAESGNTVRVRNIPSDNGLVLEALPLGTVVDVLEEMEDWSRIRYNGGINGYMMAKFLRREGEPGADVVQIPREVAQAMFDALKNALL